MYGYDYKNNLVRLGLITFVAITIFLVGMSYFFLWYDGAQINWSNFKEIFLEYALIIYLGGTVVCVYTFIRLHF